ncbi:hypothetical protein TL16_g07657 [Triparma laevis f. inornata]|uniref:Uncharacterized protein n=2 Tax=Triparma laevis TaxID=1534972 RepID=A0A9W7F703_9STRA|nr:hypothetical protein TL16_g07657 [Triparma laevis f. inornata]GMI03109.1 hypothetical protein TrLO_g2486 [Triparma laevis f. longispina]
MQFSTFLLLLSLTLTSSFHLPPALRSSTSLSIQIAEVDATGNNLIVKKSLVKAQESGLLTKVYESGLLSSAKKAGVKLSSLEPFLKLADENPDLLILVEAAGPDILPLIPTIVDTAPALLPILATLIKVPSGLILAGGVASAGLAFGIVSTVPDDSVVNVAVQTLAVGVFGLGLPAVSFAGAKVRRSEERSDELGVQYLR